MSYKYPEERKRLRVSGTLPQKQHEWVEEKIKEGRFYNWSHALQIAFKKLQAQEDKAK